MRQNEKGTEALNEENQNNEKTIENLKTQINQITNQKSDTSKSNIDTNHLKDEQLEE